MSTSTNSRYKNAFMAWDNRPWYSGTKLEAGNSCRLRGNNLFLAMLVSKTQLGVLPSVPNGQTGQNVKVEAGQYPINLKGNKPISDFTFSPHVPTLLAATNKQDGIIQCWDVEYKEYREHRNSPTYQSRDAADYYLAGHEQRATKVVFHPSINSCLASSSLDGTLRVWDIQRMTERCCLTSTGSYYQSFSFSPNCELLVAVTDEGSLEVRDLRAPDNCALVGDPNLQWCQPSRGVRVVWPSFLLVQPGLELGSIVTSCVNRGGARELELWDQRNLRQPTFRHCMPNSLGQVPLDIACDETLPILYASGGAEQLKMFEVTPGGSLEPTGVLEYPKSSVIASAPLGKVDLLVSKCEITRFSHVTVDHTVLSSVVRVPRVNGETVFQQDLYPLVPSTRGSLEIDEWLSRRADATPALEALNVFHSVNSPVYMYGDGKGANETPSHVDTKPEQINSTKIDRSPSLKTVDPEKKFETWKRRDIIMAKPANAGDFLICQLELRNESLMVHLVPPQEEPLALFDLEKLEDMEFYEVGGARVIKLREHGGSGAFTLKFGSPLLASKWENLLALAAPKEVVTDVLETDLVPELGHLKEMTLVRVKTVRSNETNSLSRTKSKLHQHRRDAILASRLLSLGDNPKQITRKWALLARNGLLSFHADTNENLPPPDLPPLETVDTAQALSLGVVDLELAKKEFSVDCSQAKASFFILLSSRKLVFGTNSSHESANWITQLARLSAEENLLPLSQNLKHSFCEALVTLDNGAKCWITCINGTLYYFASNESQVPFNTVKDSQVDCCIVHEESCLWTIRLKGRSNAEAQSITHTFQDSTTMRTWLESWDLMQREGCDFMSQINLTEQKDILEVMRSVSDGEAVKKAELRRSLDSMGVKCIELGENKKLICFFGRTQVSCHSVDPSSEFLCADGVYLLELGDAILQYDAPKSSRVARAYALGIGNMIRKLRTPKPKYANLSDDAAEAIKFAQILLGVSKGEKTASGETEDALALLDRIASVKLFSDLTDLESKLTLYRLQPQNLLPRNQSTICYEGVAPTKTLLHTESTYLLVDYNFNELFLWIGKSSSPEDRAFGGLVLRKAAEHLVSNRSKFGAIEAVRYAISNEGSEDPIFKSKFVDYEGMLPISMRIVETKGNIAAPLKEKEVDLAPLYADLSLHKEIEDDLVPTRGVLTVYLVCEFSLKLLFDRIETPLKEALELKSHESYLCVFQYAVDKLSKAVAYFWQGSKSSQLQMGTAAMLTVEVGDSLKGICQQVRVVQGKEPFHFRRLFSLKGLVHSDCSLDNSRIKAFDVRISGTLTASQCVAALQQETSCIPFHQKSTVLILDHSTKLVYLWKGALWTGTASCLESLLERVAPSFTVKEGFNALPDDLKGACSWPPSEGLADHYWEPKLFNVSSVSGAVTVKPVSRPWSREDLDNRAVMVMDTLSAVWIWFGSMCRLNEKIFAMRTFKDFIGTSNAHIAAKTRVIVTVSGAEPVSFWGEFHGWKLQSRSGFKSLDKVVERPVDKVWHEYTQRDQLTVEQIKAYHETPTAAPAWVNVSQLEAYISEDEFVSLLGMPRTAFSQLGQWKRDALKRKVGIF